MNNYYLPTILLSQHYFMDFISPLQYIMQAVTSASDVSLFIRPKQRCLLFSSAS